MSDCRQEFNLSLRGSNGRATEWGYFQWLCFQRLTQGSEVTGSCGGDYPCWLSLSLLYFSQKPFLVSEGTPASGSQTSFQPQNGIDTTENHTWTKSSQTNQNQEEFVTLAAIICPRPPSQLRLFTCQSLS